MDQWTGRADEPRIKEATVKRFHYDDHNQLCIHLVDFIAAYTSAADSKHSVA